MRISPKEHRWRRSDGSALMAVAIAAGVLGIMVTGFLAWITNEYRLSKRSDVWTEALYLAESGAELGCAELNFPYLKNGQAFSAGNGWSAEGSSAYRKSVNGFTDGNGQTVGDFSVLVSNVDSWHPVIQCVGTATASQGPPTSRAVQIWLKKNFVFPYSLAAKQQIVMNGNAFVDSFDSSDSNKSTGGTYDPSKRSANAVVASTSTGSSALDLGTVYGTAATGPLGGASLGSIGPSFDPLLRANTVGAAESRGWLTHDFNLAIPDVTLPAGLSSAPNLGAISSGTTISSGDWQIDSITTTDPIIINGNARVYVKGDFNITSSGYLQISPGASLEIYMAGDVKETGNGVINLSGLAANNKWYGLSSSTDWKVTGSAQWIGIVYAPQASVKLAGNSDMFGALVGNDIKITGSAAFHYDEALGSSANGQGYVVLVWQELRLVSGTWEP